MGSGARGRYPRARVRRYTPVMSLAAERVFQNHTGEGVVEFEPWVVSGPLHTEDNSRWYAHLRVRGQRVFEYGCPCGTCGIVFRKLRSVDDQLSDSDAVDLLGALDAVPGDEALGRLARVLPRGTYVPFVMQARVRAVDPGGPEDYFSNEVVRLFGLEPPEYTSPSGPWTGYWRVGEIVRTRRTTRPAEPHSALLTSVAMPLHDITRLDRPRIEYWKQHARAGRKLTAFALSVLDEQEPAMWKGQGPDVVAEHFLLTHCILDGHHRIQAAAELGLPVRILSLWSEDFSRVSPENVGWSLDRFRFIAETDPHI
jgi:hypothetical protein